MSKKEISELLVIFATICGFVFVMFYICHLNNKNGNFIRQPIDFNIVNFNNHTYIEYRKNLLHNPDCKCFNK